MRPSKPARMVASGTAWSSSSSVAWCHRAVAASGAMSGGGQLDGERAAPAQDALTQDPSAEQLDELAGDVQAEARALPVPAGVAELLEGVEEPGLVGLRDPDAGVDDVEGDSVSVRAPGMADDEADPARLGELDGVVDQV